MNALYAISNVYVSTHHGEGWGLTLSDAMLLGIPAIATGYSGNLHYMTEDNAFLIPSEERNIETDDCFGLFSGNMKWAYPRLDDIASNMVFVAEHYDNDIVIQRALQAKRDVLRFNRQQIRELIHGRLSDLLAERQ
ncbi:hypothetical protein GCM10011585_36600 [Edaphobacter dinghuensis]|uniref:Glycosyl transferase family 1 domain-containing protein n=1 Tax=Edaphobacter dinghuensis TaxID=1560005 RepID=A0A917HU07_9BACT|nr:hypothetical protein GCM10011585_36600 [Edaphobacter dinghuensis]